MKKKLMWRGIYIEKRLMRKKDTYKEIHGEET